MKADDVKNREWMALPAVKTDGDTYEVKLPAEAAEWFALVSDDRPVTVSSDLIQIPETPITSKPKPSTTHP